MSRLCLGSMSVLVAIVLAGCANAPTASYSSIDATQVAAVEKAAARAGVRVIWVNPPDAPTR